MKIEKVDAHHHLWLANSLHHPMLQAPDMERFFGNTAGLKQDFHAAQFLPLAASQNVTRSVYVESHFQPAIEETASIEAFAAEYGFPHAIVGSADLAGSKLEEELDLHQRSPLFRGLRVLVNHDPDPKVRATADPNVMSNPAWRNGFVELGRRGLSAEIMLMPRQLQDLRDLASACSDTPLIVGHTGLPFRRSEAEQQDWESGMEALAALPQVSVKISGLGMVDRNWTTDRIREIVTCVIEWFGPQRCMFASNFPVDALHASYAEIWDAFDAITAAYPAEDRSALFRDTAMRIYGLT
ncbi:MAG TPA: amidohydrolase family protein [Sphingomicrobium sp.]